MPGPECATGRFISVYRRCDSLAHRAFSCSAHRVGCSMKCRVDGSKCQTRASKAYISLPKRAVYKQTEEVSDKPRLNSQARHFAGRWIRRAGMKRLEYSVRLVLRRAPPRSLNIRCSVLDAERYTDFKRAPGISGFRSAS